VIIPLVLVVGVVIVKFGRRLIGRRSEL
jgi:hypothetical protein